VSRRAFPEIFDRPDEDLKRQEPTEITTDPLVRQVRAIIGHQRADHNAFSMKCATRIGVNIH
jgi:hypothetical protein